MADASVVSTAVSVGTSIVTTVVALLLKDSWETYSKTNRMMLGLCIDCAGTIHAFDDNRGQLAEGLKLLSREANSIQEDWQFLRAMPNGFVVSPPLLMPKELINLLPADHARKVFLYYDDWDRYSALECRYRELFKSLLEEMAKAKANDQGEIRYRFLRDELLDQFQALARDLDGTISKLSAHCCEVLLIAPSYLDTASIASVEKLTDGRFSSWQQIRDACDTFHGRSCGANS